MKTDLRTEDAIRHFDGVVALAEKLGIKHSAVSQWGEYVPPRRAWELQQITGGALKAISAQPPETSGEAA